MINQPEPLNWCIDCFKVYREQKQPRTALFWLFKVIHEKQMFFAIAETPVLVDGQKRPSSTTHPRENQKKP